MNKYNIVKLFEVDSTNNYALSLRYSGLFKEGLVIISDYQTDGKGQRGNYWESAKGENLILSVLVEPNISNEKQFDLSKIAALSFTDLLISFGLSAKIKWPNDILIGKKKIGGVLIKNIIFRNKITYSVIGIGLNVNQLVFGDYIPEATSLHLEFNKEISLEDIKSQFLVSIRNRINLYRAGEKLDVEYLELLFKKDKFLVFESRSKRFDGVVRGVTDSGRLMVETQGVVRNFDLKEIKMLF